MRQNRRSSPANSGQQAHSAEQRNMKELVADLALENCLLKKSMFGVGERAHEVSRIQTAEIIRIVEQSHLPVRQTLAKLGFPRATFYRWYYLFQLGGIDALKKVQLLRREVKPDDLRAEEQQLTAKGVGVFRQLGKRGLEYDGELTSQLGQAESAIRVKALRALIKLRMT